MRMTRTERELVEEAGRCLVAAVRDLPDEPARRCRSSLSPVWERRMLDQLSDADLRAIIMAALLLYGDYLERKEQLARSLSLVWGAVERLKDSVALLDATSSAEQLPIPQHVQEQILAAAIDTCIDGLRAPTGRPWSEGEIRYLLELSAAYDAGL